MTIHDSFEIKESVCVLFRTVRLTHVHERDTRRAKRTETNNRENDKMHHNYDSNWSIHFP